MIGDRQTMSLTETGNYSPGTTRRLRQKLNHLFFKSTKTGTSNNNLSSVIETDYLHGISDEQPQNLHQKGVFNPGDNLTFCLSDSSYFGVPEEVIEEEKWQSVASLLRDQLRTEMVKLHLDLFIPNNLLERISKDIVRMSVSEPYGLRGCTLHPSLSRKGESTDLGVVECDWNTVSTFELHLTLFEDKKRWYSIKDLIAPVLPGCLNESQALEVFISPGFKLVKHKLYRPN